MALIQRACGADDIDAVMTFFREVWGERHILGRDREFLLWQMPADASPAFAGAALGAKAYWDGDLLVGLIGVTGMDFNCDGAVVPGAWLCNLGARPDYLSQGVGVKLMTSVHALPIQAIGASGINLAVIPMYRAMRYHAIDSTPRFIRVVDAAKARALISGDGWEMAAAASPARASAFNFSPWRDDADAWNAFWRDFTRQGYFGTERDARFITWRYLQHPRLDYRVTLARGAGGQTAGALVHRLEQVRDRDERVLRVIELIAHEASAYEALLGEAWRIGAAAGAAYIDHYTTQPRQEIFRDLGWFEEDDLPGVVVPGLFQPLLRQTRKINLAVRLIGDTPLKNHPWREHLYVVKSDGDQDRPN